MTRTRLIASFLTVLVGLSGFLFLSIERGKDSGVLTEIRAVATSLAQSVGKSKPDRLRPFEPATSPTVAEAPHAALIAEIMSMGIRADEERERQIAERARALSTTELQKLGEMAIDPNGDMDVRNAAVFILSEAGAGAVPALTKVASTKFDNRPGAPHSVQESKREDEVALRITALEALDTFGSQGTDIRRSLQKVLLNQDNETLQLLARVALTGLDQGRPGKLFRFIEASLEETVKTE